MSFFGIVSQWVSIIVFLYIFFGLQTLFSLFLGFQFVEGVGDLSFGPFGSGP